MTAQQLYVDGTWMDGSGTPRPVQDKWTGNDIGSYAVADTAQVSEAPAGADRAYRTGLSAHRRAAILRQAAALVEERTEALASLLRQEAGKPITAARGEVGRCVQTLLLSAAEASRIQGQSLDMGVVPTGEHITAFTRSMPLGVVGAITPFNFPLNLVAHKLGPALAAGCPVVLKPSERTPLSSGALVDILAEAGLPAGW